ncbi:MAG: hypothetical protein HY298_26690 [Verrucomicrobia bacterium]|nr:hypothetical protein [Verrucomicrobiota bacterium]
MSVDYATDFTKPMADCNAIPKPGKAKTTKPNSERRKQKSISAFQLSEFQICPMPSESRRKLVKAGEFGNCAFGCTLGKKQKF